MKNKFAMLYIAVFFIICLLPVVGIPIAGSEVSSENRKLSEAPKWKTEDGWNLYVLKDAGQYFEDHFAFRNEMVTAYALITGKGFGVSAQDSVIVGKNSWLYYKDSLDDYQGTDPMTERQLFDTAHTLAMMQTYAQELGIDFRFTIAPNKNTLYSANMPGYLMADTMGEHNSTRLLPYLKAENVSYVDLFSVFEKQDEVLYHARDSHWNNKGAAIAADALLNSLNLEHKSYIDCPYEVRKDFEGDLDRMLYPNATTLENEIYYTPQPQFTYCNPVESNFDPKIETESEGKGGSLVMYRDSFGNALLPYMAENYVDAYFSRGIPYQLEDLYTYEANTLIVERAERFLPEMACNAPQMPAPIVETLYDIPFDDEVQNVQEEEIDIYTRLTGTLPEGSYDTDSRIFIRVNDLLDYEAFPVTNKKDGTEGFQALLLTELLEDENEYEFYIEK